MTLAAKPWTRLWGRAAHLAADARAVWKTVVFLFKVFPMLPSRPLNWVTPRPVVEKVRYPTSHGDVEGDLYRPSSPEPCPGMVVSLPSIPSPPKGHSSRGLVER